MDSPSMKRLSNRCRLKAGAFVPALACACLCLSTAEFAIAQNSNIYWQEQASPQQPANGAVVGGPGDAPEPNSPLFVCRAVYQASTQPGKWVKGNCNVTYNSREIVARDYQVLYGPAEWRPYTGNAPDLLQTGNEADGTPLYSCRVQYRDHGYQPGKLTGGKCDIPYNGREVVQRGPFEALYVSGDVPYVAARDSGSTGPTPAKKGSGGVLSKLMANAQYQQAQQNGASDDDLAPLGTRTAGNGQASHSDQEKRADYIESHSCMTTDGADKANALAADCEKVTRAPHKDCNIQQNTCDEIRKATRNGCYGLAAEGPDWCLTRYN